MALEKGLNYLGLHVERGLMTAEGRSLNFKRTSLCLGDVSLIKLGVSEEEYVHLSSEVRMFHDFFFCLVYFVSKFIPYIILLPT